MVEDLGVHGQAAQLAGPAVGREHDIKGLAGARGQQAEHLGGALPGYAVAKGAYGPRDVLDQAVARGDIGPDIGPCPARVVFHVDASVVGVRDGCLACPVVIVVLFAAHHEGPAVAQPQDVPAGPKRGRVPRGHNASVGPHIVRNQMHLRLDGDVPVDVVFHNKGRLEARGDDEAEEVQVRHPRAGAPVLGQRRARARAHLPEGVDEGVRVGRLRGHGDGQAGQVRGGLEAAGPPAGRGRDGQYLLELGSVVLASFGFSCGWYICRCF